MIPAEIISKKRDGLPLDKVEIKNFIHGYLSGDITKAQMSALLMAIYFKSMNKDETLCLVLLAPWIQKCELEVASKLAH